tara:strand:- start:347 stop:700 length:354 start_codon:yes stop_codon:yes gene_type:complete
MSGNNFALMFDVGQIDPTSPRPRRYELFVLTNNQETMEDYAARTREAMREKLEVDVLLVGHREIPEGTCVKELLEGWEKKYTGVYGSAESEGGSAGFLAENRPEGRRLMLMENFTNI